MRGAAPCTGRRAAERVWGRRVWLFGSRRLSRAPEFGPPVRLLVSGELIDDLNMNERAIHLFGAEATVLGLVSARWGYIHDKEREVLGATRGYGLGADMELGESSSFLCGIGFRYDSASVPGASDFRRRVRHDTFGFRVRM